MSSAFRDFLSSVGLEDRLGVLTENGIDLDVVGDLTADDLKELGLNLGERKRFLKAALAASQGPEAADVQPGPERRQLTVMFVDLVGSTSLSAAHDVEDYRTVVQSYQQAVTDTVQRHNGTVAKYMGDGVLAYFGYPSATEHSAEHAARCGLDIIEQVKRLTPLAGVRLSCRVAAATGKVIVGDLIGEGGSQERQVVGDTPNLAGRLQSLAEPDQMVVAGATYQLVHGLFECRSLGSHSLKGFDEAIDVYAVVSEKQVESRFRATREVKTLAPLHGRDAELAALIEAWSNSLAGQLQATVIVADAGVGKSRLLAELESRVSDQPYHLVEFSCHPQLKNSALRPLRTYCERMIGWARTEEPATQFAKLAGALTDRSLGDKTDLFASILEIPPAGLYEPPPESPQLQRAAFAAALGAFVHASADGLPLFIILEDLHWADATTLEVLELFLQSLLDTPAFFVATSRPTETSALASSDLVSLLELDGIKTGAAAEIASDVAGGKRLPADLLDKILSQAEGNPLYVEELTKSLLESGLVREEMGQLVASPSLSVTQIPATLQDSLMARLDRVATSKELAQTGSVIGREFDLELIAEVLGQPPDLIAAGISVLEQAEIVFPVTGKTEKTWIFKHALIQEAAYDSLLKSRRRELHGLIAHAYEKIRPDLSSGHPEIMAHHLGNAGEHRRAIGFGLAAGMGALVRSANNEAVAHGLACQNWASQLGDAEERGQLELKVHAMLTPALMQSQGYTAPDAKESARRGLELLEIHGDRPEAFPNLWGLNLFHHVRSERKQARDLAERFVALAERIGDGDQLVVGLPIVGHCSWIEGSLGEAETDLRRAMDLYDVSLHRHHGAHYGFDSLSYAQMALSQVLWMTGRIDQAMTAMDDALAHARELKHTNTVGLALLYRIMLKQQMGLRDEVTRDAAEALDYCGRMGVSTPTSYISMIANWAKRDVDASRGVYEIHDMVGAQLGMTYYRSLGVDVCIETGDLERAREILKPAMEQARHRGERYWLPQLLRLQSKIVLASGDGDPTSPLREAAVEARTTGASLLEALALIDLLRLDASDRQSIQSRLETLLETDRVQLPAYAQTALHALKSGVH